MLFAVMNLSTVLQLEGAQGFQGPQQDLEKQMVKGGVIQNVSIFYCNLTQQIHLQVIYESVALHKCYRELA